MMYNKEEDIDCLNPQEDLAKVVQEYELILFNNNSIYLLL